MTSKNDNKTHIGTARTRLNRINRSMLVKSKIRALIAVNWSEDEIANYLIISKDLISQMYGFRKNFYPLGSKTEPYFESEEEILKSLSELNYTYDELSYSEKKIYNDNRTRK
jgi:hypothetical protein